VVLKKYVKEIMLGVIIFLLLGLYGFIFYEKFLKEPEISCERDMLNSSDILEKENKLNEEESVTYFVDIKGAVVNPGVYKVDSSSIINDVVVLAGGFNASAHTSNINLSKSVSNHMVIYVFTKYEYSLLNEPEIVYVEKECKCESYDIQKCIESGSSVIEEGKNTTNNDQIKEDVKEEIKEENNTQNEEKDALVNINTATISEFTTLNGIGESKAQKIIDYRNENGLFSKIEDIKNVSGISDATFEKIKDSITV